MSTIFYLSAIYQFVIIILITKIHQLLRYKKIIGGGFIYDRGKTANRQRTLSLKYRFERKSLWDEKRVKVRKWRIQY